MKNFNEIFDRYKIRTKMMVMYFIVIIPLFIGSMYLLGQIGKILSEKETNDTLSNADRLRVRLIDMIQISENVSGMISGNDEICSFLETEFDNKKDIYRFYADNDVVKNYLKVFPQLKYIRIYIDREDFAYNSYYRQVTDSVREQKWYFDVMNGESGWRIIRDSGDKELYLSYITPIYGSDGSITAAAVIEISPDWISEFIYESYYKVVFSVNNGVVFYSGMDGVETGTVIASSGTELNKPDQQLVLEEGFMGNHALTVFESFQYDNSVFQIYLVNPGGELNEETKDLTLFYTGYVILLFVLSLLIVLLFTSMFSRRIGMLRDRMHSVASGQFDAKAEISGRDEISELNSDLSVMVDSMRLLMKDAYQAKLQNETFKLDQMEAEFKALASQINPHFLYNTLETIRMKAFCNDDRETAGLIKLLGKFMRRCLEVKDSTVTLKSELDFTNSYLELQGARFGDRVSYEITNKVDENYQILPLVIQPVVENAFVHGIEGLKENGKIDVHIYYCGEYVYVDVRDNGQGITAEKMRQIKEKLVNNDTSSGKSIGLTNVNKRIKMYHGDEYGISLTSEEGKGCMVRIMLPRNSEAIKLGKR